MAAIQSIGACFEKSSDFQSYLEHVSFNLWRPRFIVMHHTGAPNLATWRRWKDRGHPTDAQWMKNLAAYYGDEMRWSAGPHFFFTPTHYCVLSPPDRRGVHAASFNALSWGVECVGDFDREPFDGALVGRYLEGLAIMHIAAALSPGDFRLGVRGLHFHRDDPKTNKTCPGEKVSKPFVVAQLERIIAEKTGGDHPDERIDEVDTTLAWNVRVASHTLNVRSAASAKAPVEHVLKKGDSVTVIGKAMNGKTEWLNVKHGKNEDGWIAARFTVAA